MVLSGNELGEVCAEGYLRRCREIEQRYGIQGVREPLRLLLPVHVQAPECVLQRFRTHVDLSGQRLLVEELEGTSDDEVLGEVVVPVNT